MCPGCWRPSSRSAPCRAPGSRRRRSGRGFSDLLSRAGPEEPGRFWTSGRRFKEKDRRSGHIARRGQPFDGDAYEAFLREIGYSRARGDAFSHRNQKNRPAEIATVAGPLLGGADQPMRRFRAETRQCALGQSLRRILRARTRWATCRRAAAMKPRARARVGGAGARLSATAPFRSRGSHADAHRYHVDRGQLLYRRQAAENACGIRGYRGHPKAPERGAAGHNGLHGGGLVFDPDAPDRIARRRRGWPLCGWKPLFPRSWIGEDSVACVDAEEQGAGLWQLAGADAGRPDRNHREKGGAEMTRALSAPTSTTWRPDGAPMTVKGRCADAGAQRGPHLMT